MATHTKPSQSSPSRRESKELLHLSGLAVGQELIPECEVILEDEEDSPEERWNDCEKNPGHPSFIPVKVFGFEHLPEELRTEEIMRSIKRRCDLTVRIVVRFISKDRPDTFSDNKSPYPYAKHKGSETVKRYGTGLVISIDNFGVKKSGKCPCRSCKKTKHPKMEYWVLIVKTATHAIYDDSEAERAVFHCFYDSQDKTGVKKLFGISIIKKGLVPGSHYKSDICNVMCVTHDKETIEMLLKSFKYTLDACFEKMYSFPPGDVIVSHPHGYSKHITVGNSVSITFLHDSSVQTNRQNFSGATICRLPLKNEQENKELMGVYRYLIRSSIKPLPNGISESPFFQIVQPYMNEMILATNLKQGNIYSNITGIACGLYKFAIVSDLISSTLLHVKRLNLLFSVLISNRLTNMKISDTKTPELIDMGLLLWKCCFILVEDLLKSYKQENILNIGAFITKVFLLNIYAWNPQLLPMFDLLEYVDTKSTKRLFSNMKDAFKTVGSIILGVDSNDEDDNEEGLVSDDNASESARFFNDILPILYWDVGKAFDDIYRYRRFHDKNKTLVDSDSDEFLQPGTEFLLPVNMTFTLPPEAEFFKKSDKKNLGYYMFPPGTKYHLLTTTNHCVEFSLLEGAEFFNIDPSTKWNKNFMSYDTRTCKGSSGAYLESTWCADGFKTNLVHLGAVGKSNASGMGFMHENDTGLNDICEHAKNLITNDDF